jgi:putative membrane protein
MMASNLRQMRRHYISGARAGNRDDGRDCRIVKEIGAFPPICRTNFSLYAEPPTATRRVSFHSNPIFALDADQCSASARASLCAAGAVTPKRPIMLNKLASLPILALAVFAAPLSVLAQTQPNAPAAPSTPTPPDYYWPGPGMMWRHGYGDGHWGGYWGDPFGGSSWEMFPMWIVLVILVCVLIFYFARSTGQHHWGAAPPGIDDPTHSALQILNERFARSEIQKDEYEDKKSAILSGRRT